MRLNQTCHLQSFTYLRHPVLKYAPCCWDPLLKTEADKLQVVHCRAARVCYNIPRTSKTSTTVPLKSFEWEPLVGRQQRRRVCLFRAMLVKEVNTDISSYSQLSIRKISMRHHRQQYTVAALYLWCGTVSFGIAASLWWLAIGCMPLSICGYFCVGPLSLCGNAIQRQFECWVTKSFTGLMTTTITSLFEFLFPCYVLRSTEVSIFYIL